MLRTRKCGTFRTFGTRQGHLTGSCLPHFLVSLEVRLQRKTRPKSVQNRTTRNLLTPLPKLFTTFTVEGGPIFAGTVVSQSPRHPQSKTSTKLVHFLYKRVGVVYKFFET